LNDYVTENFIWQMALKIQKKQSLLSKFRRFVDAVPGKKWFGLYRFMPFCFLFGAGMEWTMIHWTVGETNFYRTYMKRRAKDSIEEERRLQIRLKEAEK